MCYLRKNIGKHPASTEVSDAVGVCTHVGKYLATVWEAVSMEIM